MDLVSTTLALLTTAASGAGMAFSKKAGEAVFKSCSEYASRLLAKVRRKAEDDQILQDALNRVLTKPADTDSQSLLDSQLRKACERDVSFAHSLEDIIHEAQEVYGDNIFQIITVQQGANATIIGKTTGGR